MSAPWYLVIRLEEFGGDAEESIVFGPYGNNAADEDYKKLVNVARCILSESEAPKE